MLITLKLFGIYQKYLPQGAQGSSIVLEVSKSIQVSGVISMVKLPADEQYVVLVNGIGADLDQRLLSGDVVAVFQSIAGGSTGIPSSPNREI